MTRLRLVPRLRALAALVLATGVAACAMFRPEVSAAPEVAEQPVAELDAAEKSLRDRVAARLADRLGDGARQVRIRVDGTSVSLTGVVDDRHARGVAHDAAHEVFGVMRVDTSGLAVGRARRDAGR